jgi:poly-gamma-glutamate synthesis protein (capsule biosynthesis protein)
MTDYTSARVAGNAGGRETVRLMLAGDVMTGRGIDQILPFPSHPAIHEGWRGVYDARRLVELAERRHGPLPASRDAGYVWGDLPGIVSERRPDLRIVNLETAITRSSAPWPGKPMHFRMSPENAGILSAVADCCALANNHTLDWGYAGLEDTLDALRRNGIAYSGAGENESLAWVPAVLNVPGGGRVLLWSLATPLSGAAPDWAATAERAGICLVVPGRNALDKLARAIASQRSAGDLVVVSIHWGGNWGYRMHEAVRGREHALVDRAGVDVVHGHSSHHVRGIEIHRGKLILYGCGDLINDYEGIVDDERYRGYERFRPELGALYFADLAAASGTLESLTIVPVKVRKLRIQAADGDDAAWLAGVWNRLGADLGGTRVTTRGGNVVLEGLPTVERPTVAAGVRDS